MEQVRKTHNLAKRALIHKYTQNGSSVLDVGCGYGGDLNKWQHVEATLTMGDPSQTSLEEAERRMKSVKMNCRLFLGTIENAPREKFDVVCYNFSLQYVFCSKKSFYSAMFNIKDRVKRGGCVFGCIPDSDAIIMNPKFKDSHGNQIKLQNYSGQFGDKIDVMLEGTPYYNGKFISEPIAHKDLFLTWMETNGFRLIEWTPLLDHETGIISDLYSKFCFLAL